MRINFGGFVAVVGAGAAMLALGGQSPASAMDRDDNPRAEIREIRIREDRLRDLECRRDEADRRRDWRAVRSIDDQISRVRRDIEHDRWELERARRDRREDNRRYDYRRDDYRRDDWRWSDRSRSDDWRWR